MPLSRILFRLDGRVPRFTFWVAFAAYLMALQLLGVVNLVVQQISGEEGTSLVVLLILFLINIVLGLMWFAVLAKRAHDRNHPGWYPIVVGVIPILGMAWLLIEFGFFSGTDGPNKYGDDPRAPLAPAVP